MAGLMRRQHGLCTWQQAAALGLPTSTVSSRVRAGRYRAPWPGVIADAGTPESWERSALAAALHLGGEAVLSHHSAAYALGIAERRPAQLELLVRQRVLHGTGAIRLHRTRQLPAEDVTRAGLLPATNGTRTIADLAATTHDRDELRGALARAARLGLTDAAAMRAHLARRGRIRGKVLLTELVDELSPLHQRCRSELESMFLELMARAGLPPTAMNHPVTDAEGHPRVIDAVYLPERLPIELDSRLEHGSTLDQHDDAGRQNNIVLVSWRSFLRFWWHEIADRPDEVVAKVRAALHAAQLDAARNVE